ncbi:AAA family ATPase [Methylocella sp.]|uniref:ATP-binding protein n=1 Tax=Methylocella sp. TaxID=1978226 RepID=UPI0037846247
MRFESLTLECYGRFETTELAFPPSAGLCVVYGANEAGKSTALEAVGDFLYGVHDQSRRADTYGPSRLRIGATLRFADGALRRLVRRKGRKGTLADEEGRPVDESVLAAALGSTTRKRFAALFGLSHAQLREGGEALMKADGDVGRLILAAGGGLSALVPRVEALDKEADALFSERKAGHRRFYAALDDFQEAERRRRETLVTREQHENAVQRVNAARDRLKERRDRLDALNREKHRLARQGRVAPTLGELDMLGARLDALASLAPLGEDFAQACADAFAAERRAAESFEEADLRLAALQGRIDALELPADLLAAQERIQEAARQATLVRKERVDREKRERELEATRKALDPLRALLNLPDETALEAALPAPDALAAARRLRDEGASILARRNALDERGRAEARAHAAILERRRARIEAGRNAPLGFSAGDFAPTPGAETALAARRDRLVQTGARLKERCASLGYADFAALEADAFPDAQASEAEGERRAAQEARRDRLAATIESARAERAALDAEIGRLTEGRVLASPEAIEAARAARDGALGELAARYADGAQEEPREARLARVEDAKGLVSKADRLADRRSVEAERVAALELAQRKRAAALATLEEAARALKTLDAERDAAVQTWREAWPAAARFPDLGRLRRAAAAQRELVEARRQTELEAQALAADEDAHAARLAALARAQERLGLAADAPLAARVEATVAAIRTHEADYADFRADQQAADDAARKLAAIEDERRALDEEEARWAQAFAMAAAALGAPAGASLEEVDALCARWADAPGRFESLRNTRARLSGMDRDERNLAELVAALAETLGRAPAPDAAAAAEALAARLEEAKGVASRRRGLEGERAERIVERDAAARKLAEARDALERLRARAGCEAEALSALAGRCAERVELARRLRALEEEIARLGDGLPLAQLRAECAGRAVDEVRAAAQALEADGTALEAEVEAARAELQDRRREAEALEDGPGVNAAAVAREAAAAQMHEAIERHLEAALAGELLREAMARLRERRKDPLVTRAGALFGAATRGAFAGVRSEVSGEGEPSVVGLRADGTSVPVGQMSEGARDQLYLAFRVASVEAYAAAAEPIPFIADDLLVHFDDARSAAALELLAELGERTQTLLFTHHRGVREAALALAGSGRVAVVDIER